MATRGSNATEAVDGRSFLGINQLNSLIHAYYSTLLRRDSCEPPPLSDSLTSPHTYGERTSRSEPNKRDTFGCWFVTICGWKFRLYKPSPVGSVTELQRDRGTTEWWMRLSKTHQASRIIRPRSRHFVSRFAFDFAQDDTDG